LSLTRSVASDGNDRNAKLGNALWLIALLTLVGSQRFFQAMPPKGQFPRTYVIEDSLHRKERSRVRQISWDEVVETIRTGAEWPHSGKGMHGGRYVRLSKQIGGRMIVVIAEVLGSTCYVITTYEA
jgi:hypothetical protein